MTENMKKFLEFTSTLDKETMEKVCKMDKGELISYASDHGFTLTEEDLEKTDSEGEVSLNEADAVAGGGECRCFGAGGGASNDDNNACGCVIGGGGTGPNGNPCYCVMAGVGGPDR